MKYVSVLKNTTTVGWEQTRNVQTTLVWWVRWGPFQTGQESQRQVGQRNGRDWSSIKTEEVSFPVPLTLLSGFLHHLQPFACHLHTICISFASPFPSGAGIGKLFQHKHEDRFTAWRISSWAKKSPEQQQQKKPEHNTCLDPSLPSLFSPHVQPNPRMQVTRLDQALFSLTPEKKGGKKTWQQGWPNAWILGVMAGEEETHNTPTIHLNHGRIQQQYFICKLRCYAIRRIIFNLEHNKYTAFLPSPIVYHTMFANGRRPYLVKFCLKRLPQFTHGGIRPCECFISV